MFLLPPANAHTTPSTPIPFESSKPSQALADYTFSISKLSFGGPHPPGCLGWALFLEACFALMFLQLWGGGGGGGGGSSMWGFSRPATVVLNSSTLCCCSSGHRPDTVFLNRPKVSVFFSSNKMVSLWNSLPPDEIPY